MSQVVAGEDDVESIVVDGQQRITTTTLLLASILHYGPRLRQGSAPEQEQWSRLQSNLESLLFLEKPVLRLVPSVPDRDGYRDAVLRSRVDQTWEYSGSYLGRTRLILDKLLGSFMDTVEEGEKFAKLEDIGKHRT